MYISAFRVLEINDVIGVNLYGGKRHIVTVLVNGGNIKYLSFRKPTYKKGDRVYAIHRNKKLDLVNNSDLLKVIDERDLDKVFKASKLLVIVNILIAIIISCLSIYLIIKGSYAGNILLVSLPFIYYLFKLYRGYGKLIKTQLSQI